MSGAQPSSKEVTIEELLIKCYRQASVQSPETVFFDTANAIIALLTPEIRGKARSVMKLLAESTAESESKAERATAASGGGAGAAAAAVFHAASSAADPMPLSYTLTTPELIKGSITTDTYIKLRGFCRWAIRNDAGSDTPVDELLFDCRYDDEKLEITISDQPGVAAGKGIERFKELIEDNEEGLGSIINFHSLATWGSPKPGVVAPTLIHKR